MSLEEVDDEGIPIPDGDFLTAAESGALKCMVSHRLRRGNERMRYGTVDAPLSEGSAALMSSSMRLLSAGVTASAPDLPQREAEGMRRKLDALHHAGDLSDGPHPLNAHDTRAHTAQAARRCAL